MTNIERITSASVLMLAGSMGLAAQGVDAALRDDGSLIRYALTQGGLLAVLILGAWMYRRDFVAIFGKQTDTIRVLTSALTDSTAAITSSHAAIESLDRNVDRLIHSTDQLQITMVNAISNNRDREDRQNAREDRRETKGHRGV